MQETDEQEQILWSKEVDDYVRQVHFIFDGMYVLCTTSSGKVYAFSKGGNNCLFQRQIHQGAVIASDVSYINGWLATGSEDGKFLITDLMTGKILYGFEAPGKWIENVQCSPDGQYAAFSCGKKVRIVHVINGLYDTIIIPDATVSAIAWHQDSETLAIGFFGGVNLYSISGKTIYQFLPWKNAVVSLTISPDKKFVCSGTQDYQVHIWPLPYTKESDMAMSGFPNKVKHLHWHYEGYQLATNSGQTVVIWDFSGEGPSNKEPDILKGHFFTVTALAFQHTNDVLASGDDGGLLFFFCPSISNKGECIINISQPVTALCWSPDDKTVAVGTAEGGLFMIENPLEIQ